MSDIKLGKRVPGYGPADARIMIVGEAPGAQEEILGRPFVGRAGEVLRQALGEVGIREKDVYFTNLCKHRPPRNELVGWYDRKTGFPNEVVLDGLRELRSEIQSVRPNVILAAGNFPLAELTGLAKWDSRIYDGRVAGYKGITDWRGSILDGSRIARGSKVVATLHPSAVDRDWSKRVFFLSDLNRLREQSAFPEVRRPEKNLVINPQGSDRQWWRDRLLSDPSKLLTFDIEYIGNQLLCVSFTTHRDEAVVIPTKTGSDIQFCRELLHSGIGLNGQNLMFDVSILEYWYSFKIMQYVKHDTMLAAHSAYIELPKDLGTLCSLYTEQPCYWDKIHWPSVKAGKQSVEDVYKYNAIDAWVTHQVMEEQLDHDLTDPKVRATFEFELSLMEPLWEMSRKGIPVDRKKLEHLRMECEAEVKQGLEFLSVLAEYDFTETSLRSPKQMRDLVYGKLGCPVFTSKKTGPTCDDKELAKLDLWAQDKGNTKVSRAIQLIRKTRKAQSLITKFCEIEFDADGRMRSHYKIGGTTTGRLSTSKFFPTGTGANQQNQPRDKRVRKVFVPDDGCLFFYNDLERAESLVVAQITQDPLMLQHHAPGADAHKLLAGLLFDVEVEDVSDDMRYMGKQTRHAGNYMEGWKTFMDNVNKLASVTGVSIDAAAAKKFIGRYRELHPGLTKWWSDLEYQLKHTRKLENLFGRPRTFYDRVSTSLPTAVAFIPQSTVGDTLNYALLNVWRDIKSGVLASLGVELLVQVHDALGGQFPSSNAEVASTRIHDLMQVPIFNPRTREHFTIPVEIAFGPSWGEVKKWTVTTAKAA